MSDEFATTRPGTETGAWRLLSALGVAAVLAVAIFVLTSDGSDVSTAPPAMNTEAATEPASTAPETTTTASPEPASLEAAATDPAQAPLEPDDQVVEEVGGDDEFPALFGGSGEDAAASSMPAFLSGQITNMGPTEIGVVTNFPTVDYTWERIEITGPGLSETGWLGELGGNLVAVSTGELDGTPVLVTATSPDGINWEQAGLFDLPDGTWIVRIVGDGERIFAIGQTPELVPDSAYLIYSSSDGIEWATAEVSLELGENEHAYVQSVAAGSAGVALAVGFDTYPAEPPVVLSFEEYEVILDHMRSTYTLTEIATGAEVLSGRLDDLFHWGGDGQMVYNPETGEIITVVPWQVWERAWVGPYGRQGISPLPIPIGPQGPSETSGVTIEYDGFVIIVDDLAGRFTVTDAESGEPIASGTLDDLYQGPPPEFIDPDSGDVLLAVTWDEWRRAEEEGWQNIEYGGEEYFFRSRTGLMTSPDGETWTTQVVNEGSGGGASFLAATEDGFVAMVNTYGEFGENGEVWKMVDGVWTSQPAERTDLWLRTVATTNSGLVAVGEGSGGPALWSSSDGVSWSSDFALVPQDDGSYAHLSSVAADGETVGALAVRERWSQYRPLEIVQDQYTATFEDGEAVVRVRSTESDNEILVLIWEDVDSGLAAETITWADGATTIDLGDAGSMVITDEEAYAAMDDLYGASNEIGLSVFLDDGSGWTEAVVDVEGSMSGAAQLYITDGKILIGGSYWGEESYFREGSVDDTFVVIVGTPGGG